MKLGVRILQGNLQRIGFLKNYPFNILFKDVSLRLPEAGGFDMTKKKI
jgi:hypothetical protein